MGAHNSVVGADQGFHAPSGDQEAVRDSVHEDSASAPIAAGQRPRQSFRHPQAHGSLDNTPNGANPPLDRSTLADYSRLLAETLDANYETVLDPPPADPSQAHPESTRPAWA